MKQTRPKDIKIGSDFTESNFSPYIRAVYYKIYGMNDRNQLVSQSVIEEDFDITQQKLLKTH